MKKNLQMNTSTKPGKNVQHNSKQSFGIYKKINVPKLKVNQFVARSSSSAEPKRGQIQSNWSGPIEPKIEPQRICWIGCH